MDKAAAGLDVASTLSIGSIVLLVVAVLDFDDTGTGGFVDCCCCLEGMELLFDFLSLVCKGVVPRVVCCCVDLSCCSCL